jgi:cytochrome c oxidase subunit 4
MEQATAKEPPYLTIFLALGVLTAVEIGIAFVGLPRLATIIALIVLALWKALLVALYYMHLLFEPRRLWLVVSAPLPLAVILVLAVLTERW